MSLHNDIKYLNDTIEKNEALKLSKTELKEQEKQTQQIIDKIMRESFEGLWAQAKSFEDIRTLTKDFLQYKNQNINTLGVYYEDKTNKKANENIIDYISNNYNRIMLETRKDHELIYKIDNTRQKEIEKQQRESQKQKEAQTKEEAKRQEAIKKAYTVQRKQEHLQKMEVLQGVSSLLLGLTCLLGLPFLLIIFFIIGIVKNTK